MLEVQVKILTAWLRAGTAIRTRMSEMEHEDRGEVTATTALIVILVIAAIAAGGVIAAKIASNANAIPSP